MENLIADRMSDIPKSFIREMLKIASQPNIISFAGGLPNKDLFPTESLTAATENVFKIYGNDVFQYSNSEGFSKLRAYIAETYSKKNIDIPAKNILITNGAQQGLDLIGKVLLNEGDGVIIEEPGYLGAIQAFSLYNPYFSPVAVSEQGMDLQQLERAISKRTHKLLYAVPNFQNPSGITYSKENRVGLAEIIQKKNIFIVEDDPYGELRFSGSPQPSFKTYLPDKTIMLGSFSKIIVPGFRIGWIAAPDAIFEKLLIAKQASDLHTCNFTQYIIHQYLQDNAIDTHIERVISMYSEQCQYMTSSINRFFPKNVQFTQPEGGMFLWVTLPSGISAMDLFDIAVKEKVAFVPGTPFYINGKGDNTLRLNFSSVDTATIETGIKRLGNAMRKLQENQR